MKNFNTCALRRGLLCLLLLFLIFPTKGFAKSLTFASIDFTENWNPLHWNSYPAILVARFTSEALFLNKCIGEKPDDYAFDFYCQSKQYDVETGGDLTVNLNQDVCGGNTKRPLALEDIKFTTEQIQRVHENPYHQYGLAIDLKGKYGSLTISRPKTVDKWAAKRIMSFPILRREAGDNFYNNKIGSENQDIFNSATGGVYKVDRINPRLIKLVTRKIDPATDHSIDRLNFEFFNLFTELVQRIGSLKSPDVVLAIPFGFPVDKEKFSFRASPDLNSFTYVGFNFSSNKAYLFTNLRFRKLFTHSLWANEAVKRKMNIDSGYPDSPGIFLGESFASLLMTDRLSDIDIQNEVSELKKDLKIKKKIRLDIVVSPAIEQLFDNADRSNIQTGLNYLWNFLDDDDSGVGKIQFQLITPSNGWAGYNSDIANNRYDMNFETFFYGRSHLRYMAFVRPKDPLNKLQIPDTIMPAKLIQKCMDEPVEGEYKFRDLVNENYPVAVLGTLRRRDLISTTITHDKQCSKNSKVVPYYRINEWTVKE